MDWDIKESLIYRCYSRWHELKGDARRALYNELMEYAKTQKAKTEETARTEEGHQSSSLSEGQNRVDS